MRGYILGLLFVAFLQIGGAFPQWTFFEKKINVQTSKIQVYFSPNGGATDAIVREISTAKKTIKIQAYGFSSVPITDAIIKAKERGVGIDIILDKSNNTAKYSSATFLENHGIIVMIDHKPHIAHSKIMIIDSETIITGSFNFTKAAEYNNTENLLIINNNPDLVKAYLHNFENREKESSFYKMALH